MITSIILWWAVSALLGVCAFPIAWRIFPRLSDRGYGLSRALGLLAAGYLLWIGASFGVIRNNFFGALLVLIVLAVAATIIARNQLSAIQAWLKANAKVILTTEILFLVAFAFWAFIRANTPEIQHTEKPMELAFLNAILKSDTFPPRDPWLSDYAISYYYFGYIMLGYLTKLTGVLSTEAFNLGNALWFALTACGAYSVLFSLFAMSGKKRLFAPLLGPLFILLAGNLEVIFDILHHQHVFWPPSAGVDTPPFWSWLGLKNLANPPTGAPSWIPSRYLWWWQASRVIYDVPISGNAIEMIDEFPFFSFLLADNHPHVLALPFVLLAIGFVLNLFMSDPSAPAHAGSRYGPIEIVLSKIDFWVGAWLFGSLAFLNLTDFPIYLSFLCLVIMWKQLDGFNLDALKRVAITYLGLIVFAVIFYLPWYPSYSSQVSGILPNILFPTRVHQFLIMFAPFILPIIVWLANLARPGFKWKDLLRLGSIAIGIPLILLILSSILGIAIYSTISKDPGMLNSVLSGLGVSGESTQDAIRLVVGTAGYRRLTDSWTAILLGITLGLGILILKKYRSPAQGRPSDLNQGNLFVIFLIGIGALLLLGPEFLYVRDSFGHRMNTVFKFYYAAWVLWGLAAAYATVQLWPKSLHPKQVLRILVIVPLLLGLLYPILSLWTKTNGFNPQNGWTLDGMAYMQRSQPEDYAAIQWINDNLEPGIILESVGGSYSQYARISTHTGFPTLLGWPYHEFQWRGDFSVQGSRESDVAEIYTSVDAHRTKDLIDFYGIDYVYIGPLERITFQPPEYPAIDEGKFKDIMRLIYHINQVSIYARIEEGS